MAKKITVFADGDIVTAFRESLVGNREFSLAVVADNFADCYTASRKENTEVVVMQLQNTSDIGGCLDFMHALDGHDYKPVILLFEKRDDRTIVYSTTDPVVNPVVTQISALFQSVLRLRYSVSRVSLQPATLKSELLTESVLGREEALKEILRGCSAGEIRQYKRLYSLDLKNNGFYLFFWELQMGEYHSHYYNKDVYNLMGRVLEKKYLSILEDFNGGEEFRIDLDIRCIIINDLTDRSQAVKAAKLERMFTRLYECGKCRTASTYLSERVSRAEDLRLARDEYAGNKGCVFFLRSGGLIRASRIRLLRSRQMETLRQIPPLVDEINNLIRYNVFSELLDQKLQSLFFDHLRSSLSYSLYYYSMTSIGSVVMKELRSESFSLIESLTPENLRFSSLEEQYDLLVSYVGMLRGRLEGKRKTQNAIVNGAVEYIRENFRGEIVIPDIAKDQYISYTRLSHIFKSVMGVSLANYIVRFRIDQARQELLENGRSVSQVAESVGFHDLNHFSKTFKRLVGMSPTEYRQNYREN